ncbi:MAG: hypothetical protein COA69_06110 [Robiginitomaculum sp.]|nr:MAG: hypothetical protein COA69_06110 [Robiginitomaculum sp.]
MPITEMPKDTSKGTLNRDMPKTVMPKTVMVALRGLNLPRMVMDILILRQDVVLSGLHRQTRMRQTRMRKARTL